MDYSKITEAVFAGSLFGMSMGAYGGKTLAWTIAGALFGIGLALIDYMRNERKKHDQHSSKEQ